MLMDAIVLAGGRSSRLGGRPKAQLLYHGTTLLDRAIAAATDAGARRIVVVGDVRPTIASDRLLLTRENPPFGGPVAGIGAGAAALSAAISTTGATRAAGATGAVLSATTRNNDSRPSDLRPSELTLVLACDLPHVSAAVSALIAALPIPDEADGLVLVDAEQKAQLLTALYRSEPLAAALAAQRQGGTLDGLSVRALIGSLQLRQVPAPAGVADDVDTPEDADRHGIKLPPLVTSAAHHPLHHQ